MSIVTTRFDRITVAAAMHHGVASCRPTTPLSTVAREMAAHRIHCVVVRDGRTTWGVVSDLDLVAAAALGGTDLPAGSVAATATVTIRPRDSLSCAMRLLAEHQVTHLVVVDGQERPTGVISTLDIAEALAEPL